MTTGSRAPASASAWARRARAGAFRLALVAAPTLMPWPAFAQDGGDDDLAAKAADPTASLKSFQLTDIYTASFHGIDETANQPQFRAVLPWQGLRYRHILRVTQPLVTAGPGPTGITDTTAFGCKWRPNVEAGYEFRDLAGNPKWTIRAGVTLLLPIL